MAFAAFMASEAFMPAVATGVGVIAAAIFVGSGAGGEGDGKAPWLNHDKAGFYSDDEDEDEAKVAEGKAKSAVAKAKSGAAKGDTTAKAKAKAGAAKAGAAKDSPSGTGADKSAKASDDVGETGGDAADESKDEDKAEGATTAAASAGEIVEGKSEKQKAEEDAAAAALEQYLSGKKKLTPDQEAQIRRSVDKLPPETRKALSDWINMEDQSTGAMIALNCMVLIFFLGIFLLFAAYLIGVHEINLFEMETWYNGTAYATELLREYRILPKARPPSITAEL